MPNIHVQTNVSLNENKKEELKKALTTLENGYDVIYNTVPSPLFDRGFLERVCKKTLIIELASGSGGIDLSAAKELCSNVLWASSLPGKYAPESAGKLIGNCVDKILGEVLL